MVEFIAGDGTVCTHEIGSGGSNTAECSAATVGLTLADGKRILAALQDDLVRAQAEEYRRQRRVCSHCRSHGRSRMSARGGCPRWHGGGSRAGVFPCRCAVTHQRSKGTGTLPRPHTDDVHQR
jgi:hypothetical protein